MRKIPGYSQRIQSMLASADQMQVQKKESEENKYLNLNNFFKESQKKTKDPKLVQKMMVDNTRLSLIQKLRHQSIFIAQDI